MAQSYRESNGLMGYLAAALGAGGVLMAWLAHRRNQDLTEQVERVNSRVYHLRQDLDEATARAEQEKNALKFEILKLKGHLHITPDMRIGQVVAAHPQAQQVLAGFHIGGCSSCSVDDTQVLGDAVAENGRDIEPILVALNTLMAESKETGTVPEERLKRPNVQLQL